MLANKRDQNPAEEARQHPAVAADPRGGLAGCRSRSSRRPLQEPIPGLFRLPPARAERRRRRRRRADRARTSARRGWSASPSRAWASTTAATTKMTEHRVRRPAQQRGRLDDARRGEEEHDHGQLEPRAEREQAAASSRTTSRMRPGRRRRTAARRRRGSEHQRETTIVQPERSAGQEQTASTTARRESRCSSPR